MWDVLVEVMADVMVAGTDVKFIAVGEAPMVVTVGGPLEKIIVCIIYFHRKDDDCNILYSMACITDNNLLVTSEGLSSSPLGRNVYKNRAPIITTRTPILAQHCRSFTILHHSVNVGHLSFSFAAELVLFLSSPASSRVGT